MTNPTTGGPVQRIVEQGLAAQKTNLADLQQRHEGNLVRMTIDVFNLTGVAVHPSTIGRWLTAKAKVTA